MRDIKTEFLSSSFDYLVKNGQKVGLVCGRNELVGLAVLALV